MTGRLRMARARSIRARTLRIALLPCVVVLLTGLVFAGFLLTAGAGALRFADAHEASVPISTGYGRALSEERAMTMAYLGTADEALQERMIAARTEVDRRTPGLLELGAELMTLLPPNVGRGAAEQDAAAMAALTRTRVAVDNGQGTALGVLEGYSQVFDRITEYSRGLAHGAHDVDVAMEQLVTSDVLILLESINRANAVATYAARDPSVETLTALGALTAAYHRPQGMPSAGLPGTAASAVQALRESPEWAALIAADNALVSGTGANPEQRNAAAGAVVTTVSGIYTAQIDRTVESAKAAGRSDLLWSGVAALGVLLVSALTALSAYRAADALITRIASVRRQVLDIADRRVPELLDRVGRGEPVDLPVAPERSGADELGEVAVAFGKAQRAVVSAAVSEARTRHGVRLVFLNIAHRSQALVHRQLETLDTIERSEDNPDLLERLFQLDHLATRARRSAENLIILGGEDVGRQWRRPVALRDVVRGALSESTHYTRVTTTSLPDIGIDGAVVADLGHLLAELVDNGTSFSPPGATVYVRGAVTGTGAVVEVEDQGLGIDADRLGQLNTVLGRPSGFDLLELGGETQIGLYVVATLAAKHRIRVTLRESAYGGVHAIVLLPATLLADTDGSPGADGASGSTAKPGAEAGTAPPGRGANAGEAVAVPVAPRQTGEPVHDAAAPEPVSATVDQPAAAAAGTAGRSGSVPVEPPPLPTRVRNSHLAPQLAQPVPSPAEDPEGESASDLERTRAAMSAFQRGTAQARAESPNPIGTPHSWDMQ